MSIRGSIVAAIASALLIASPVAWSVPIVDGGWDTSDLDGSLFTDHIDRPGALNAGGVYAYLLTTPAIFRITDVLVVGDTWTVLDFGAPILTTIVQSFASGFGDNAAADGFWTDAVHSKGEVALGLGAHSITVSGDGASGVLPAHYFARIDTVPVPATLALLGIGLAGLGLARRR